MASSSSLFPLLILPALLLMPTKSNSQNVPVYTNCAGDANYTVPSTFAANLDLLLSNLTASVPLAVGLFSTATAGAGSSAPAFGLAQCHPDATASDCAACLNRSAAAAPARCPRRTSAAVRFDLCVLRYSDPRFFSQLDEDQPSMLVDPPSASDPTVFNQRLGDLMDDISSQAAASESRFAVGTINFSDSGTIYGMGQCTRDLSESDCYQCLGRSVALLPTCCYGRVGGRILKVSCALRFQTYSFFSLSVLTPAPPPPAPRGKSKNTTKTVLVIVLTVVAVLILLFIMSIYFARRKPVRRLLDNGDEEDFRSGEPLLFNLDTLRAATNNFLAANKLGEGGFGPVYKGILRDEKQIAVKRLSRSSGQILGELRNKVVLFAKLQHRNLVRLLGCCLEAKETLLVYEYFPNTSLDKFLFDPIGRKQLDWRRRYRIIEGIGRGLLYLHEDSPLRIIHQNLKASNILLDWDMNPRISDFELAELFSTSEPQGNSSRIAGTHGYMAPECARHGHFSTKSDVFSYGVLVLEILTGRRTNGFQGSGQAADLLSYVLQHWNEGMALQMIDRSLGDRYTSQEVLRCIHTGLLCIQEDPQERPDMASIVLMLTSSSVSLPAPSMPAFFVRGGTTSESEVKVRNMGTGFSGSEDSNGSTARLIPNSINGLSITEMEPR